MADDRDSLLREVDEELRRDQMNKIWERYSGLIFGVAAMIVAGVWGYKFLESRRIAAAESAGAEFTAAAQLSADSKNDDAQKAFETIAASGPGGYAALAKLQVAGAQAKAGKTAEALATFEGLAKEAGADDLLKSFAQVQAASLRLGEADYAEMQTRLGALAGEGSPFKTTARELLGFAAFKSGKLDEARKQLEPLLIDPAASRAIQERIKIVMAQITAAETPAAPAAQPAAAPVAAPAPAATAPAATDEPEKK
jgi:hypothetical protein